MVNVVGFGEQVQSVKVRWSMWSARGTAAANFSLVATTMIKAFLEDFGVLEVSSVVENYGFNPLRHSSVLAPFWYAQHGRNLGSESLLWALT